MNKKLLFLTKNSLKKKIKSKWFLGINILLLIATISLINIDSIISFFGGDFTDDLNIIVVDNVGDTYDLFKNNLKNSKTILDNDIKITVKEETKSIDTLEKNLDKKVLIVIDHDDPYIKAKLITKNKINAINYQLLTSALSATKYSYGLSHSNINPNELALITSNIKIDRVVLDKENSVEDNTETIMGAVFPTIILPFFMLVLFLIQMIGSEIYEEKSSRSMEIIISNVSPKTHFISKILSSNIFAITQGLLLFLYGTIGILINKNISKSQTNNITETISDIFSTLNKSGFIDKLGYIIPITLVLLLLSFLAYSLVAGILASQTVNMDDYQQIQTPIMLVSFLAYYLSIMASMFNGSLFIKIFSYLPFISCLLSPALLVIGQITIKDVLISIIILILFNYLMLTKGMKVYKEGILNYSSEKVWIKFKKSLKSKN